MIDSDRLKQNLDRLSAAMTAAQQRLDHKHQPAKPPPPQTIAKQIFPNLPSVHDKDRKG